MDYETRLAELGETLPEAAAPAANYVPFVQSGALVFVSGQLPMGPGGMIAGKLGADLDIEAGQRAARRCALNLVAQLRAACGGDLNRLRRVVKLTGFVNGAPGFSEPHKVMNGCSDFLVDLFGDAGRHARSAVCAQLPMDAAVEIEAIFEIA